MRQRTALLIAAALTAFVLVIVGGLAARLTQGADPASAPTEVVGAPTAPPPAVDPPVEALVRERAAAYQADLPAANAQITTISHEQAIQAAVAYRGGGEVVDVELDAEHGRQVYEVKFRDGSKVYVDAAGGQVVYAKINNDEGGAGHDQGEGGDD